MLAGRLDDFPPGRLHTLELGSRLINLIATPDGFYALGDKCPHQGAPLHRGQLSGTMVAAGPGEYAYGLEGEVLRCPWHRWEFLVRNGQTVLDTSPKKVVTYPVRAEGGSLYVSLPGVPPSASPAARAAR